MSAFCNIKAAYSGNDMDELDKMARNINNKRKEQAKKISGEFNDYQNKLKKTVENIKHNHGFNFFKEQESVNGNGLIKSYESDSNDSNDSNNLSNISGISGISGISNKSVSNLSNKSDSCDLNELSNDSEYSSISSSISDVSDISDISDMSDMSKTSKNDSINNNEDCISTDNISLDSLSNDGKIITHVSKCKKCKKKILKLIKKHKKYKKILNENIEKKRNYNKKIQKKEFIIIYFISILIIFIIDLIIY